MPTKDKLDKLYALYERGEKIAILTCYDATFAKLCYAQGVDVLLVGDSLGMVIQGHSNTLQVSLAQMVYHTESVARGAPDSFIISDLPIHSYEQSLSQALHNARALLNAGASMVKLEGAYTETVAHLVAHDILVCGHLGFTPQSVEKLGGYKVQGRSVQQAGLMLTDAEALQAAGASLLVMEMIPADLAKRITDTLHIPTIGIGAGIHCDGQVLVLQDILGIYTGPAQAQQAFRPPRFVYNFLADKSSIADAIHAYVEAVKEKAYPRFEHSY